MISLLQALWKGDLSTIPGSNRVGEEVGEDDDADTMTMKKMMMMKLIKILNIIPQR